MDTGSKPKDEEEKIDTSRKTHKQATDNSFMPEKPKKLNMKFNIILHILPYYGNISDGELLFTSFAPIKKKWNTKFKELTQKVSENSFLSKIVRI